MARAKRLYCWASTMLSKSWYVIKRYPRMYISKTVETILSANDKAALWILNRLSKIRIFFDNTQTRWSFTAILLSISIFILALPPSIHPPKVWTVILLIVGFAILLLVISLSVYCLRSPITKDPAIEEIKKVNETLTNMQSSLANELKKINQTLDSMNKKLGKK